MKRYWVLILALGLLSPIGLVGCGEKSETTVEQETPGGTTEETTTTKQTGENPPAPTGASGEPAPAP